VKFETMEKDGAVVVSPKGRMMAGPDLDKIHEKIKELVEKGTRRMVMDLGEVDLMDSRGLGVLVAAFTSLKGVGGEMRLARTTKKIQNLIVITHLTTVFKSYDSVDEALKNFQN